LQKQNTQVEAPNSDANAIPLLMGKVKSI